MSTSCSDDRRKLADYLQKHYVKTSASPLKTRENEIEISKVYVKPEIEIVKNESTKNKEYTDSSNNKPVCVENYHSIFNSHGKRLRRIYLLGEFGSGKSAFCKMMILNWCRSVTKQTEQANCKGELENIKAIMQTQQTDQANCKDDLENIETMKQFDFLFFLPLRRLQGNGRIREMIQWYYKDLISVEKLNDILLNVPEKCVILADGLDEWAPNADEHRPQHVTDGLPYLEDIEEVTVLTTSRPSAAGVLNMKFTESDQKLVVKGIHSIEVIAEKYILLINEPKSDSKCILDHLYAIEIGQLEKTPLLLQQLVWMFGNGIEVGKCMSNVYSSLVNIALRWAEEKGSKKKIESVRSCNISSELHLPKQLLKYDACRLNRNILFTLGKIAFELLVPENNCDSQMSFGRGKLNEDGLDDDTIDTVLSRGLLTEDNCHDNIEHRTQFAFAHASFQEYFAALYVASHLKIDQNQSPDASKIILERLFRRFCSVQNILQFRVVLQMLCGLAPEIIHDVCEHVYQIANHDSAYSNLRNTFLLKKSRWFHDKYVNISRDIQALIASCITEYNCNAATSLQVTTVPLLDLAIVTSKQNQYSGLLQFIIPQKVIHLSLCEEIRSFTFSVQDIYEKDVRSCISDIVFQNLQTIAIECYGNAYFNLFTAVIDQHLLKTLSVRKCMILSFPLNECVLNLSGHHQLELLNTNCEVVSVDVKNIEILILEYTNISTIIQGGVAPKLRYLEVCAVRMFKRELTEFAKFISRNVLINVLKLNFLSVIEDDKPSAATLIDLSSHDNLQVLEIGHVDHISIKSFNTTNLHTVRVTTDRKDVLYAVRNAQKLTKLHFCMCRNDPYNFLYSKEMNEIVCSCSQLQDIEIQNVVIQDEALEISCSMRNLICIKLEHVMMRLPSWIRFVDSLLNLKQSVTVKCSGSGWHCDIREFYNNIFRKNKTFKLKEDWRYDNFEFETLP